MTKLVLGLLISLLSWAFSSLASAEPLQLKDLLQPYLNQTTVNYSIYVKDLRQGDEWVYNNRSLRSASMIKIWIMAEAFHQADQGKLNLSENVVLTSAVKVGGSGILSYMPDGTVRTWRDLIELMIVESDNTATNLLLDKLGLPAVQDMIDDLDGRDTKIERKMMDFAAIEKGKENWTTVNDVGHFFELLYAKQCVSPDADEQMLHILQKQEDNDKIPALLPKNVKVAHKTGELAGILHDGGIVFTAKGDYIVCILADGVQSFEQTTETMAKMSRAIYEMLEKR